MVPSFTQTRQAKLWICHWTIGFVWPISQIVNYAEICDFFSIKTGTGIAHIINKWPQPQIWLPVCQRTWCSLDFCQGWLALKGAGLYHMFCMRTRPQTIVYCVSYLLLLFHAFIWSWCYMYRRMLGPCEARKDC